MKLAEIPTDTVFQYSNTVCLEKLCQTYCRDIEIMFVEIVHDVFKNNMKLYTSEKNRMLPIIQFVGFYLPLAYFNIIVTVTEMSQAQFWQLQVYPYPSLYSVESILQLNTVLLPAHSLCLLHKVND